MTTDPTTSLHYPPNETAEATLGDRISEGKRFVEQRVEENPASVMMLSFVVGAGVGTMLGMMLLDQGRSRRRHTAEGFLSRVADTVTRAVHDSMPDRLRRT